MPTPEKIIQLVERFDRNREAYRSGKYNETQVRKTTSQLQIDHLACELCRLTADERNIVEGAT